MSLLSVISVMSVMSVMNPHGLSLAPHLTHSLSAWTEGPGPHTVTGPGEARGLSLARPGPEPGSGEERLTSPSEAGARIEASLLPRPLPCSTVMCPLSGQGIKLSSDL